MLLRRICTSPVFLFPAPGENYASLFRRDHGHPLTTEHEWTSYGPPSAESI